MKITLIGIAFLATFLTACDKELLNGLNIKFQGEVNSNYKDSERNNSDLSASQSNSTATENKSSSEENSNIIESEKPETFRNKPVREVNNQSNSDPDAPLPFYSLKDCSDAGITAKTNEVFYAKNPNLKSISSKNQQQVKEWKSIYQEIQNQCE